MKYKLHVLDVHNAHRTPGRSVVIVESVVDGQRSEVERRSDCVITHDRVNGNMFLEWPDDVAPLWHEPNDTTSLKTALDTANAHIAELMAHIAELETKLR